MQRYLWLVMGLLLLVGGRGQAQTDADGLPYIYYYDNRQEAFVIERIDGTDTRLLGQGTMYYTLEEQHGYRIDGPGWSPSGEWFAWTAAPMVRASYGYARPFIISADGQEQPLRWDDDTIGQMLWSPDTDLLLMATSKVTYGSVGDSYSIDNSTDYETLTLALWDMATQTEVYSIEMRLLLSPYAFTPNSVWMRWTDDGQYALLLYTVILDNAINDDMHIPSEQRYLVLDRSGGVVRQGVLDVAGRIEEGITANGEVAVDNGLIIANLWTGDFLMQPVNGWLEVYWSPDETYALLFEYPTGMWRYSDGVFTNLSDSISFRRSYDHGETNPEWSPSGRTLVFSDEQDQFYVVNSDTWDIQQPLADKVYRWSWVDETHLLLFTDSLLLYDVVSGQQEALEVGDPTELHKDTQYELSSDGQYLAFMGDGAVVYDRESGMAIHYTPDPDAYFSALGGEVQWIDDWLLSWDDTLVAGGGTFRGVGVQRIGSRDYRHLTYLDYPTPNSLGFLPPQVRLEKLPEPLTTPLYSQPVKLLYGNQWIFQLAWSPDGQQIVSTPSLYWETNTLIFWDVVTGEMTTQPTADTPQAIVWTLNTITNTYHPMFVDMPVLPADAVVLWGASADSTKLVVFQRIEAGYRLAVLDTETGSVIHDFGAEWTWQGSASFSLDGRYLALGHGWHPAQIWDTTTWQVVGETPYAAQGVAFSPDGQYLAASGGWDVYIWRVEDLLGDS